ALNGKVAVEKFKSFDTKPDLILMDHRMPIKNGLDAMVEILEISNNVKILFASADVSVKKKALSLGACDFLDKPFKMQRLLNTIEKVMDELIIIKY
ncbi:hypothetical protein LCGC14_2703770, partial [marine sediment metagenome]